MTILKLIKAQHAAMFDKLMNEGFEINIAMSGVTATIDGTEVWSGMLCEMIETTDLVNKYEAHQITADLLNSGKYEPHEAFKNQIFVVLDELFIEHPSDLNAYEMISLKLPE